MLTQVSEIRDDIPLPEAKEIPERKYPFGQMIPGQSCDFTGDHRELEKVRSAANGVARYRSWKFTTRRITPTLLRVWRIE